MYTRRDPAGLNNQPKRRGDFRHGGVLHKKASSLGLF